MPAPQISGGSFNLPAVYFTWPDGLFSYECRGCGACCKGLGIGVDAVAGELETLLEHYPGATPFVRKRGDTWTVFNPRGRCWFLDDVGMCRVELDHGRTAKPASCRLFPFNRVFQLGAHWIIDYNAVICPLRALEPDVSTEEHVGMSGRVRHADVLADVRTVRDPAVVGVPLPHEQIGDIEVFMARERDVATQCFARVNGETGADTERRIGGAQLAPGRFEGALAQVQEALSALGLGEPPLPTGVTLRHAVLATPSLRFNEFFGRRAYVRAHLDSDLGVMWLAWLRLLASGEEAAARPLTMQEVTSIWGEVMPLLFLVGRWRARPVLEPGPIELDVQEPLRSRLLGFGRACIENRRHRRPLQALMAPVLGGDVFERIAFARSLEPLFSRMRFVAAAPRKAASGKGDRRRKKK